MSGVKTYVQTGIDPASAEPAAGETDFERLFAAHYPGLVRIAYRVVGDAGRAEEIAAEALWRLHRSAPRSASSPGGWLYRTVLRLAFDCLRRQKRRMQYETRAPEPNRPPNPEEDLDLLQRRACVRLVLAALKPRDAELLTLRSEGYALNEMAALLNLKAGSVGVFLSRADEAFRKEYVRRYGPY